MDASLEYKKKLNGEQKETSTIAIEMHEGFASNSNESMTLRSTGNTESKRRAPSPTLRIDPSTERFHLRRRSTESCPWFLRAAAIASLPVVVKIKVSGSRATHGPVDFDPSFLPQFLLDDRIRLSRCSWKRPEMYFRQLFEFEKLVEQVIRLDYARERVA